MGEIEVDSAFDPEKFRIFDQQVLKDLNVLELMIEEGMFESGIHRMGAEQEICLVDASGAPSVAGPELLQSIDDPHLTTELGRFNLELNLDPLEFTGDALMRLEEQLNELLAKVGDGARDHGVEVVLTGILPTLEKRHLTLEYMTPVARYYALNEAMSRLRGTKAFRFHVRGRDELRITHDNVMLEACTTSFQVHYQVAPEEFALLYNIAQLVAAPVLAAATNSPLLFGHRLWRETRVALFEQSIDTRQVASHHRTQPRRVSFGRDWVTRSVTELFQEDISRFPAVLAREIEVDSLAQLRSGTIPKLSALQLRNGTVYRWNRPCYGITNGKPHLRIENRVLPAGPTVRDEVANAALWLGLMHGLPERLGNPAEQIEFGAAKVNFLEAARQGLGAQFRWPQLGRVSAVRLLLDELVPIANEGLQRAGIDSVDVERLLGVIVDRTTSGRTGSQWTVDSLEGMQAVRKPTQHTKLVHGLIERQRQGDPVHTWEPLAAAAKERTAGEYDTVSRLMSTDLFTVGEEEVVDLVAAVMNWRHLRRIPVEDVNGRLVGLVTYRALLRVLNDVERRAAIPVREIMTTDLVSVTPETPTLEAARLMRRRKIGCLPVVGTDGRLVGILTEHDLIELAWPLLERHLESY